MIQKVNIKKQTKATTTKQTNKQKAKEKKATIG